MNVIILHTHLSEDGRIHKHVKYLCDCTNFNIYHVHINYRQYLDEGFFSYYGEKGYRVNIIDNYSSIFLNLIRLIFVYLFLQFKIKSILSKLDIDFHQKTVVHIHDPFLLVFSSVFKSNKFGNVKIVYDRHEVYEKYTGITNFIPSLDRVYEIIYTKYIDGVITVSDDYIEDISKMFPHCLHDSVPNYPASDDFCLKIIENKINGLSLGTSINFVYIGSLNNKFDRDVDLLIDIADSVLSYDCRSNFYIGGPTNDDEILSKFKSLSKKYNDRFCYMGYVSRTEIINITQKAHFGFLLVKPTTSYWVKTSPNKVFEYLVCGVIPIVRANVEKANEISSCGLVFEKGIEENTIIDSVLDIMGDEKLISHYMNLSSVLSKNYRWELVAKNYEDMYSALFGD